GRWVRLGGQEPGHAGVRLELDARAHAEVLRQAGAVGLDGLHADPQALGDLVVRVAPYEQREDLALPRAEELSRRAAESRGGWWGVEREGRAEAVGATHVDEGAPAVHGVDGEKELLVGGGLEYVASRARSESTVQVDRIIVRRED